MTKVNCIASTNTYENIFTMYSQLMPENTDVSTLKINMTYLKNPQALMDQLSRKLKPLDFPAMNTLSLLNTSVGAS